MIGVRTADKKVPVETQSGEDELTPAAFEELS